MAIVIRDERLNRSQIAQVQYPNNIFSRLADLELGARLPHGGVRGGGDPNAGGTLETPRITAVAPQYAWDPELSRWVISLSVTFAYAPPSDFMHLHVEINGPGGFYYPVFIYPPYASPSVISDVGLQFNGDYFLRVRAATRSRGYTEWSDFAGPYHIDADPRRPEAPTNVRRDMTINPPFGYTYAPAGGGVVRGEVGILWDWDGGSIANPDEWEFKFWHDGQVEADAIIWSLPGVWRGVYVQNLQLPHTWHFRVRGRLGPLWGDLSGDYNFLFPAFVSQPPTLFTRDTAAGQNGWAYPSPGVAGIHLKFVAPALQPDQYHLHEYVTGSPTPIRSFTVAGDATTAFITGLSVGTNYTYKIVAIKFGAPSVGVDYVAGVVPDPPNPSPPTWNVPAILYAGQDPITGKSNLHLQWVHAVGSTELDHAWYDLWWQQAANGKYYEDGDAYTPPVHGVRVQGFRVAETIVGRFDRGVQYNFWINAESAAGGYSANSAVQSFTIAAPAPPPPPTDDTFTKQTDNPIGTLVPDPAGDVFSVELSNDVTFAGAQSMFAKFTGLSFILGGPPYQAEQFFYGPYYKAEPGRVYNARSAAHKSTASGIYETDFRDFVEFYDEGGSFVSEVDVQAAVTLADDTDTFFEAKVEAPAAARIMRRVYWLGIAVATSGVEQDVYLGSPHIEEETTAPKLSLLLPYKGTMQLIDTGLLEAGKVSLSEDGQFVQADAASTGSQVTFLTDEVPPREYGRLAGVGGGLEWNVGFDLLHPDALGQVNFVNTIDGRVQFLSSSTFFFEVTGFGSARFGSELWATNTLRASGEVSGYSHSVRLRIGNYAYSGLDRAAVRFEGVAAGSTFTLLNDYTAVAMRLLLNTTEVLRVESDGDLVALQDVYARDFVASREVLATGDVETQANFRGANGTVLWWGSDTNLYRSAAGYLKSDSGFSMTGKFASGGVLDGTYWARIYSTLKVDGVITTGASYQAGGEIQMFGYGVYTSYDTMHGMVQDAGINGPKVMGWAAVDIGTNESGWTPILKIKSDRVDATADYWRNGTKVLGTRATGWTGDPTGTLNRTTFVSYAGATHGLSYSAGLVQALDNAVRDNSRRLAALIVDLRAHGMINT
jgi:hypothetical protein